jgi:hypothetical protein
VADAAKRSLHGLRKGLVREALLLERYFFGWSSNGAIAKRCHAGKAAYQKQHAKT